eukprot:NODE_1961_length_713_cov_17.206325_g1653_i0.p1 GENE.NODE_1961_length_713_cov_17.206325_g1653_i0~~NODE_1961_length_713_cov_17.206325_g1653_i0.p1  ORF type:complete len:196 (-),score=10.48 NODE_1961_length_713_cov_17.206325_g1653_i0:82-669(-)
MRRPHHTAWLSLRRYASSTSNQLRPDKSWTQENVLEWVDTLQLSSEQAEHVKEAFRAHLVDGQALRHLNLRELRHMGISSLATRARVICNLEEVLQNLHAETVEMESIGRNLGSMMIPLMIYLALVWVAATGFGFFLSRMAVNELTESAAQAAAGTLVKKHEEEVEASSHSGDMYIPKSAPQDSLVRRVLSWLHL